MPVQGDDLIAAGQQVTERTIDAHFTQPRFGRDRPDTELARCERIGLVAAERLIIAARYRDSIVV